MILTPRKRPTVWAENHHLHQYEKMGVHAARMLVEEATISRARTEALVMRDNYRGDGIIYEQDGTTVRSLFGVHEFNHMLEDLLVTEELVELAMSALDSDVYVHQLHINYKQAFVGGGYFWHSDYTYWRWEDGMPNPRCVTMVIPLDFMDYTNGPLFVHAGSHMYYGHSEYYRSATPNPDSEIRHDEYDAGCATEDQLEMLTDDETKHRGLLNACVGGPGDVFMLDANLLHMSGPNWGPVDRACAFVCLNSVENQLRDPYSGRKPRPQYITNRNVKPLGWMVREEEE